jgi:hypothetical protein
MTVRVRDTNNTELMMSLRKQRQWMQTSPSFGASVIASQPAAFPPIHMVSLEIFQPFLHCIIPQVGLGEESGFCSTWSLFFELFFFQLVASEWLDTIGSIQSFSACQKTGPVFLTWSVLESHSGGEGTSDESKVLNRRKDVSKRQDLVLRWNGGYRHAFYWLIAPQHYAGAGQTGRCRVR